MKEKKQERRAAWYSPGGTEDGPSDRSTRAVPGRRSVGWESPAEEQENWTEMDPEEAWDPDLNMSRDPVWSDKEGEERPLSESIRRAAQRARSSYETAERTERVGHELHGTGEGVRPEGAAKTPEARIQRGGPEGRMKAGDEGGAVGEWHSVSRRHDPIRRQAEDYLRKRQERDR